jgi:hypothetical protein
VKKMMQLHSIQQLFAIAPFTKYESVVVHICKAGNESRERNGRWLEKGKTGYWNATDGPLIAVSLQRVGSRIYDVWVGVMKDGAEGKKRREGTNDWIFQVKGGRFKNIGWYNLAEQSYQSFYGKKAAGPRVIACKFSPSRQLAKEIVSMTDDEASEILREVWVRGPQHRKFRNDLKKLWGSQCSVYGVKCNGLLRASHIVPWSRDESIRGDVNNGLLLASPLDALFDAGLVAFDDEGKLLRSKRLTRETQMVFGILEESELRLEWSTFVLSQQKKIRANLARHRGLHASQHGYAD